MTEHRLAAVASVIFLLTAAFAGGASVLFLQDSEMVTVTFGNVGNTGPSATESGVEELSTSTNWSEEDGVLVKLEPSDQTALAGTETEYDLVVKGATDGIAGYGVYLSLNDSNVATFQDFDPNYNENFTVTSSANEETINITAGATDAIDYDHTDEYTLGTITVNSSSAGQVGLTIENTTTVTDANNSWYTITRQNGTLTVTTTNVPPTAENDSYNMQSDGTVKNGTLIISEGNGVLQNDTDLDGDELTVSGGRTTTEEGGSAWLMTDGSFWYEPPEDLTSNKDTFTYEVRDGNGGTDTATVTIKIPGGAGGGGSSNNGNGQGN